MKKLLALILCVMLIVSVVPTSAFAKTTSQAMQEVYALRDRLGVSYSRFGAATEIVGTVKGLSGLKAADSSNAKANADAWANFIKGNANWLLPMSVWNGGLLDYNGLFSSGLGAILYAAWWDLDNNTSGFFPDSVRAGIAKDAADKEAELKNKATAGAAAEELKVIDAATKAIEAANANFAALNQGLR